MKLLRSLPKPKRLRLFLVRRVVGNSMLPTLRPNKIVLARCSKNIKPGDVVMLSHDGLEKIKRVKYVSSNDVYVVGDNPAESKDSRTIGSIDRNNVLAKVVWPPV